MGRGELVAVGVGSVWVVGDGLLGDGGFEVVDGLVFVGGRGSLADLVNGVDIRVGVDGG